jgi:hypothetical protein
MTSSYQATASTGWRAHRTAPMCRRRRDRKAYAATWTTTVELALPPPEAVTVSFTE